MKTDRAVDNGIPGKTPMDRRIESFLADILALAGEGPDVGPRASEAPGVSGLFNRQQMLNRLLTRLSASFDLNV